MCAVTARTSSWKTRGCAAVAQTTAESHRRGAGPQAARPVERRSWRRQNALRRNWAALRSAMASSRARLRAWLASSSTLGTSTGVRAPERISRARWTASRRSVVTRSPALFGSSEGATPQPSWLFFVRER